MATDRTEPAGVASPPIEPFFLRRPEAARALAIGLRVLDELIAAGDIPVARIGRTVLIPTDELRAYAQGLKREAS